MPVVEKKVARCATCGPTGPPTRMVRGSDIYNTKHNPSYTKNVFWLCDNCGGYVGCHAGTSVPLGTCADKPTREARHRAHLAFDPLWQKGTFANRSDAYHWLKEAMGLERWPHIGEMNAEECAKVLEVVEKRSVAGA